MAEIREMFAAGPRVAGFDTDRWTTARLAQAIAVRFNIHYDPDHVGRLMHRLGLRAKPAPTASVESIPEVYAAPIAVEMRL